MSEDARGSKVRTRILFVANPSSDSDGSEEDGRPNLHFLPVEDHSPLLHRRTPPPQSSPCLTSPLTATLHGSTPLFQPSSSPSSTSSAAAEESTPPPSTPGVAASAIEFPENSSSSYKTPISNAIHSTDGTHNLTPGRGKLHPSSNKSSVHHIRNTHLVSDNSLRSQASPVPPIPDSSSSFHSSPFMSKKVLIVVTTDSDWYVAVDVSGAKDAIGVRERIFNKLDIRDDDLFSFSIYQTEMGAFGIGDVLTDEKLFALCCNRGDARGSLKFFISYSSTTKSGNFHLLKSPRANNMASSFIPYDDNPAPLRPKRRSRQESISSSSEQHPLEMAAGYEADIDNPDHDTFKTHTQYTHPLPLLPQHPSHSHSNNISTSCRVSRRSGGQVLKPLSPPFFSPRRGKSPSTEQLGVDAGNIESKIPPLPPPLSPNRLTLASDDNSGFSSRCLRDRAVFDQGVERDISAKNQDQPHESRFFHFQYSSGGKPKTETSKDNEWHGKESIRRKRPDDLEDSSSRSDWVLVPPASKETFPIQVQNNQTSRSNIRQQSSPRLRVISPHTGRPLAIPNAPKQPPPVAPASSNETRSPSQRHHGINKYLAAWRGEERVDSLSSKTGKYLSKGARSMEDIHAAAHNIHPTTLQPGGARHFRPPLPISRPAVSGRELLSSVLPKSYENPRQQFRALPLQGAVPGSNLDATKSQPNTRNVQPAGPVLLSNDPCPRPQSALGNSPPSPSLNHHRMHQLFKHETKESHEAGNVPRGPSPSRLQYLGVKSDVPFSNHTLHEVFCSHESYSTPPLTPIQPHSPNHGSDKPDGHSQLAFTETDRTRVIDVGESTIVPQRNGDHVTLLPQFEDSDSGGDDLGTLIWKKRPVPESESSSVALRPPLKVQINLNSSHHTLLESFPSPSVSPLRPRLPLTDKDKSFRISTFPDAQGPSWAPRPRPEDVYERLEEFFPEHDLDKPVIEANSGGTSPIATEAAVPVSHNTTIEKTRIKNKKSIRLVAQEHKKLIDRNSKGDATSYSNVMRKRSTKLWGSKLEEVTTVQAKNYQVQSGPDSPSGGPSRSSRYLRDNYIQVNTATFKWVRGELIGRGTYGRVYLALNATTGEMIAVKQVELPRTASDKNDSRQITVVQALKMESETLKDLDHPNIVQYLGFEETPTNLSIFLEYVPGGSIGSCLLKHGKFAENVTKSFTSQILSGLEYLHSRGILHRDLKADNILVEMSGVCKISDFGISKRTDDSAGGAYTAMQGTVFWMAPEVINTKKKGYNFKIDIWSVGCVVLEMWAGMRPWMGDEVVAVMFKLYQSKLPPPVPDDVDLSELADDFRRKCFAINPEERPTAAELRKHRYLRLPEDWVFSDFT